MLYDKRWDKKITADPFSLEALIAWLEMRPADEVYPFFDIYGCVMCQFRQAQGQATPWLTRGAYTGPFDRGLGEADTVNRYHAVAGTAPFTFGAALSRARAILSKDDQPAQEGAS